MRQKVRSQQEAQMFNHIKHPQHRMFKAGDHIMAHNFAAGAKWLPGRIVEDPTGNIVTRCSWMTEGSGADISTTW